jgi:large conductance mechanosensitive channel
MNTLKRQEEAKPAPVAEVPAEEKLLAEIRDLLAARSDASTSRVRPLVR